MSTADGSVLGLTQVFGSAPTASAFNLLLLAEGFTASEQNAFDAACEALVAALWATPPFDRLRNAINVFRINVASLESGADDPASAGGSGSTARTYFDATFGATGIRRLLVCNQTTALQVAAAHLPAFSAVLVVVNSNVYGGSGGSAAVYSLAAGATEIAIHEMGHSAFGLADEYAFYAGGIEPAQNQHPPFEPREPNVTTNADAATSKWRWAVSPGVAWPTMSNPDCGSVDSRPSPVPDETVGLFEGARYYHCGAYRPQYRCKMQVLGAPFCRVCRQTIQDCIAPATWNRTDLTALTGAPPPAAGNPDAYAAADGSHHVVYRGGDGHVNELWWLASAGWHHSDLTAVSGGAPAAAGDPAGYAHHDGTQHVVYRAPDGHIIELWWNLATGWHHSDLTAVSGGAPAAAGDPAGYAHQDGTQHVVYRANDSHIIELWWDLASGWHHSDLTAVSGGAPAAAGDPAGYALVDGTQHVVYRAPDGHTVELWWSLATHWHHSDLTAVSGAPSAGGDPAAYAQPADTQHVVYTADDGRLIELWWTLATGWHWRDLSAESGGALAGSDPDAYLSAGGTQHIVYRSDDDHVHEISRDGNGSWQHDNLTVASGSAPTAAGNPAGSTTMDGVRHVIYRGRDASVNLLSRN